MLNQLFLEIIIFLIAVIFCFYLPGSYLSRKLNFKINSIERLFFNTVLGIMLFTLLAFFLSWIKFQMLIPVIVVVLSFFELTNKPWKNFRINKKELITIILLLILSFIFSLTMITSGFFGDRLRLLGVNGVDGLWHLALINELKANFPPSNPGFAGVPLKGYHFLYFLLISTVSNIFSLSPITLLYKLFPPLIAFLWGLGAYILMFKWSKDYKTAIIAVLFSMFGGSLVYLSWMGGHKGLSLDSGYGMNQPIGSLLNPPFAMSIIVMIAFLFSMYQYLETKEKKWLIPIVIFTGLASLFKVYAGMIILVGFALLFFISLLKRRYAIIVAALGVAALFLTTYWNFADKNAHLIFFPWWAPHGVLSINMPWYGYDEKFYTYSKLGVIKGLVEIELYAVYIYFIGNLGTRFVGLLIAFWFIVKTRKYPSIFSVITFFMLLISILIPLFFIQTGKVFEISQMTWYFIFMSSLFASFGLGHIFRLRLNRLLKITTLIIIVILTIPSSFDTLMHYLPSNQGYISENYYKAMSFLQKRGNYNQTILQIPDIDVKSDEDLEAWYRKGNPGIIAFSNKRGFVNNEYIDFKDGDYKTRLKIVKNIISLQNSSDSKDRLKNVLKENSIVYVYAPYNLNNLEKSVFSKKIYDDREGNIIYEIIN